ncbi:hypothetical protein Q8F55_006773 [Vanrija albida]|uniref:Oxidoreductase-like domain-containing protein n=1 Tax=Vanrija albida TaxID=181172 RepID=A0ABR3PY34_9TREE
MIGAATTRAVRIRIAGLRRAARSVHATPPTARDLGAKYRRPKLVPSLPPPPPAPPNELPRAANELPRPNELPQIPGVNDLTPLHASPPSGPEVLVAGVHIPPKPVPPGAEDCCMNGCVNCVYTLYADDMEVYTAAVSDARAALKKSGVPELEWPDAVKSESGGGAAAAAAPQPADPAMAAFMALEAKLKSSH